MGRIMDCERMKIVEPIIKASAALLEL